MAFRPRYFTFDCYGTLTRFRMGDMAREMFAHRIEPEQMDHSWRTSLRTGSMRAAGRLEAVRRRAEERRARTCKKWGLAYSEAEGQGLL
jgi:2-haloacid dehalogenase